MEVITVTNNATDFFENNTEFETIIYAAGNAGKWVGYYMNKCGLEFSCYLDRSASKNVSTLNGKPIFKPEKLEDYKGKTIKIIVTPRCYKEICSDLLWFERKYAFNAICFVPQYHDFILLEDRYNINRFLGYFRRRLIKGETPTFITNDCTAGFLYESLGMMMITPLINTGMETEDYIKLCKNPSKYFKSSISELRWERRYNPDYKAIESPVAIVEDIRICFAHESSFEGIEEKWERMKKNINWNRLVFVMQDGHFNVPQSIVNEFETLKEKHLFISMRSHYESNSENIVCFKRDWLHDRDCVIENNFDLVEWINRD